MNKGIIRTTINFNAKNGETYAAFDAAAELNPVKAGLFREQAYEVKGKADGLVVFLQEMKYNLVLKADKKVYLGTDSEILDAEGKLKDDKAIELSWDALSETQKTMSIGSLTNKDDRHASGDLFYSAKRKKNIATDLKENFLVYKDFIMSLAAGDESLSLSIDETCDLSDKKVGRKTQLWEEYNFYDMPSVGALTLLSKMQSDVRNTEADIINMLRENIDAGSLKFTSAEGIQIPNSNFVLKGDTFRAQIFIAAKDTTQAPIIYVGEYDSLGVGKYEMVGDYETVKIVNGKGMFAQRAASEGVQKWGGLISMKTANGTKIYPFRGQYLVAAKTAVVSPTNMNILYLEVDNTLKISVPGYTAGVISAVISSGGKISATKKSLGEWSARPSKKGKAIVSLYADVEGKRTKMGDMEFRVKAVPPPKPLIDFTKLVNGSLIISKSDLLNAGGVQAKLEDFDFKGVRYIITSYRLTGLIKGEQTYRETRGGAFSDKMLTIIKNTKAGNSITISNIKAKRIDYKNNKEVSLESLILEIK